MINKYSYTVFLTLFCFSRVLLGQDFLLNQNDSLEPEPIYDIIAASEIEFNAAALKYYNPILFDSTVHQKIDGIIKLPMLKSDSIFVTFRDTFFVQREAELEQYKYIGQFNKLGFYIIEALFYEDAEYYLINNKSGTSTAMWTLPKLSKNNKYIANISTKDGIFPNGIQIWNIDKDVRIHYRNSNIIITKKVQIDQDEWIPEEIVWSDKNTLLIKVLYVNNWLKIDRNPSDYFYLNLKLRV